MKKHYVKVDSRNPVREVPKNEQWLFEPENKEILEKIKEGLKQSGSIDLGSFKDYL